VRLAHTYRKGRVFLAGDAAHVHSTAGGQGMNCCMQDAYNLGWKLALVVKGHAHAALLDSYEAERKPIGKQVIGAASAIHELFMAGRNSGADALLELRQSGFLADLVGRVSGLSYHYRGDDTQDVDDGMPRQGDRMPDCTLSGSHAGLSLLDLFRHGGFTLLACVHGGGSSPLPQPAHGLVTEVLDPAPPELLPAAAPPQLYLVRPDGYLGLRCALPEYARIAERLREILI
jgi:NADPH-dependent dioxygenase